jgi:hypothetical protein
LPSVAAEQVVTHVIHDLNAFDIGVNIQGRFHLTQHPLPGVRKHGARGVDDENNVLTVDRNSADQLILSLCITTQ